MIRHWAFRCADERRARLPILMLCHFHDIFASDIADIISIIFARLRHWYYYAIDIVAAISRHYSLASFIIDIELRRWLPFRCRQLIEPPAASHYASHYAFQLITLPLIADAIIAMARCIAVIDWYITPMPTLRQLMLATWHFAATLAISHFAIFRYWAISPDYSHWLARVTRISLLLTIITSVSPLPLIADTWAAIALLFWIIAIDSHYIAL